MNERAGAQLRVIKTVTNVLRAVDISAWLFGGWGLGPARNEAGGVVVGHFTDPAGNLVGVAGPK